MSKLREDLRIGLLGATAALFSISVVLLIDRIDMYQAYLSSIASETDFYSYNREFRELWWLPLAVWHVLLSVVASFVVHRYLTAKYVSAVFACNVLYGSVINASSRQYAEQ